jgi:cytochrome c peroxidase
MTSTKLAGLAVLGATLWLGGCGDDTTAPQPPSGLEVAAATAEVEALAAEVRALAASNGITPLQRPASVRSSLSLLGQALAFDKELSGNRDISCMTCHLAPTATVDGRSVSIGQGATGLGTARVHPQGKFVHRSAPPLFNLHAMNMLTWDGRVFRSATGTIRGPASILASQRAAFECGPLSALPMFPVLSRGEMRGDTGNELAAIADNLHQRTWKALMARLGAIPEYRTMFESAYPGQAFANMNFGHAGNAMGCWIQQVFAFNNSPWDRFLAGDTDALTEVQLQGAKAFLSTAKCAQCHRGPVFSDGKFHNVATPQVGPGFGDGPDGRDDFGRLRQTGNPNQRYAFRTAPLRNVELTAPYGHDGAFVELRSWVDHYSQSATKLRDYDPGQLEPLLQNTLLPTAEQILLTRSAKLNNLTIAPQTVDQITEFLKSLTDPAARDLRAFVPVRVPSGLSIDGAP